MTTLSTQTHTHSTHANCSTFVRWPFFNSSFERILTNGVNPFRTSPPVKLNFPINMHLKKKQFCFRLKKANNNNQGAPCCVYFKSIENSWGVKDSLQGLFQLESTFVCLRPSKGGRQTQKVKWSQTVYRFVLPFWWFEHARCEGKGNKANVLEFKSNIEEYEARRGKSVWKIAF